MTKNDQKIVMDRYWPFGLNLNGTEYDLNPLDSYQTENLYFLHNYKLSQSLSCSRCKIESKNFSELKFSNLKGKIECCENSKQNLNFLFKSDIFWNRNIRYFYHNKVISIYWNSNPIDTMDKFIPFLPDSESEREKLENLFEDRGFDAILDTSNQPKSYINYGFKIILRAQQLRTINWMQEIESFEPTSSNVIINNSLFRNQPDNLEIILRGDNDNFAIIDIKELLKIPKVQDTVISNSIEPLKIRGGILIDEEGSDKIIIALGLIYSSPFSDKKEKERRLILGDSYQDYFHSRANLIICHPTVTNQWIRKAKKCNPNFRIVTFNSESEYKNSNINDLIKIDLIIITYQIAKYLGSEETENQRTNSGSMKTLTNFHRIFIDDPKEYRHLSNLVADHIWILDGMAHFTLTSDITDAVKIIKSSKKLVAVMNENYHARKEFLKKFVRRTVSITKPSTIETETKLISLSDHEKNFFTNCLTDLTIKRTLDLYKIPKKLQSNEFGVSLKDAQEITYDKNSKKLEDLKLKQSKITEVTIPALFEVERLKKLVASIEKQIEYSLNVFENLSATNLPDCIICHDKIAVNQLSILPCAHVYCYDCIKIHLRTSSNKVCPYCHDDTNISFIRINFEENKSESLSLDPTKYSSKFIALYDCIKELIKPANDENGNCIILYMQNNQLSQFISSTLRYLGISNFILTEAFFAKRTDTVSEYIKSSKTKLIILSIEECRSAFYLPQVTHVIILHPFVKSTENYYNNAAELENYAVLRANQYGRKNPLKVIRLVGEEEE